MNKIFYIVRASSDYGVIIIQKINQTEGDETKSDEFYRYDLDLLYPEGNQLKTISEDEAKGYLGSRQSDGLGWGILPEDGFDTMAELIEWDKNAYVAAAEAWWEKYRAEYKAEHGVEPETPEAFADRIAELYKEDFGAYPEDVPEDQRLSPEEVYEWFEKHGL